MSEVEEYFNEDVEVPMIKGEVNILMFTTVRMRGNQDVMKTLGYIILASHWGIVPIFEVRIGWRRKDPEEF